MGASDGFTISIAVISAVSILLCSISIRYLYRMSRENPYQKLVQIIVLASLILFHTSINCLTIIEDLYLYKQVSFRQGLEQLRWFMFFYSISTNAFFVSCAAFVLQTWTKMTRFPVLAFTHPLLTYINTSSRVLAFIFVPIYLIIVSFLLYFGFQTGNSVLYYFQVTLFTNIGLGVLLVIAIPLSVHIGVITFWLSTAAERNTMVDSSALPALRRLFLLVTTSSAIGIYGITCGVIQLSRLDQLEKDQIFPLTFGNEQSVIIAAVGSIFSLPHVLRPRANQAIVKEKSSGKGHSMSSRSVTNTNYFSVHSPIRSATPASVAAEGKGLFHARYGI